jgi:hypothetical protein
LYSSLELENIPLSEEEEDCSALKIRFEEENGREFSCPKKVEFDLFITWEERDKKVRGSAFTEERESEAR